MWPKDDWLVPSTEGFLVQACHDAGFDPRIVSTRATRSLRVGSSLAESALDGYQAF
jgi:hypothetical protein